MIFESNNFINLSHEYNSLIMVKDDSIPIIVEVGDSIKSTLSGTTVIVTRILDNHYLVNKEI